MAKKTLKRTEDSESLRNYLLSLPVKDSSRMANEMAKECKVPMYTFQNWRSGRCRIPELAKDKIEEVAGKKIFTRLEN